eukprot:TRINITY_DN80357_c0_g1_i1.p1 TRINITY_DN80357_c0_g1~~TRINITY_DN80357_c0_g1_i1.p1  ORF type:complete len:399 (-),score=52.54 TRINITY_DN80357_c0_g1_i1:114-1310(-)
MARKEWAGSLDSGHSISAGAEADLLSDSSDCEQQIPYCVNGRFCVDRHIGSGSFGKVHTAIDKFTKSTVAVKFEWQKARKTVSLPAEARIYKFLTPSRHVPSVHWYGCQEGNNVMVMDLLGPSLNDLLGNVFCRGKFTLKTVLMLAVQMIGCVEFVHESGVIHRDIKPHNFCMGLGTRSSHVRILDFGLAKQYRDLKTGQHIPFRKCTSIIGTDRYASLNVHNLFEPSRRDDMESVGYSLVHFLRGDLPWQGVKRKSKLERREAVRLCKAAIGFHELCKGFPVEFVEYFEHCRSLQFADRPDYDLLRSQMAAVFEREQLRNDLRFDWTRGSENVPLPQPTGDSEPLQQEWDPGVSIDSPGQADAKRHCSAKTAAGRGTPALGVKSSRCRGGADRPRVH